LAQLSVIKSSGKVSFEIARTAKLHRGRAEELLAEIGLHVGQEMLLNVLWSEGELTQTELAKHLEIQPATLTVALRRLEKTGLIVRSRDPNDQRVSRVQPSFKSAELQDGVIDRWSKLEQETVANLTIEEQAELARLLNKVSDGLSAD
jgi:MarR family transcriptional regulator, organic hydroperoxide resistance regulator